MIQLGRMGRFVESIPVPHDPANTRYVAAGALTFGVEPRVFDAAAERARLTPEEIAAAGPDSLLGSDVVDGGVCVHVFASDGLAEYLRFDCFDGEPHYHYIVPGTGNMLVHYDTAANGPMLPWTLRTLCERLPDMLAAVGASGLLDDADPAVLAAALQEVGELATAAAR